MKPKATIVIPTLNEADNITSLIERIERVRERTAYDVHVQVTDASSPDGTGRIVEDIARTKPWVSLYTRAPGGGLGDVYKDGMRHALRNGADVVFEMDADHSHDPERIPAMLEALEEADFVIGSRYVKGGQLPEHWPLKRRVISALSNLGARSVLGLKAKDCSGGFRAIRRDVIERADLDTLKGSGYGFQISLLYRASKLGYRIREVPIAFEDRTSGESKMRLADMTEMAWLVCSLRFSKVPR
ncbi:MAG: polyprenol monophosphomannose synthase [Candidatus Woesearchaeota archaeon]